MRASEVRRRRLQAQRLTPRTRLDGAAEVVRWLGAVQAQDHRQALWAMGARLRRASSSKVEAALESGAVVRTWPFRGTIHSVAAEDARWMVRLGAVRQRASMGARLAEVGVTPAVVAQAERLLVPLLAGGPVARVDLVEAMAKDGLEPEGQRAYHVLVQLALDEVVCLGPVRGTTQTFALLDQWVPPSSSRDLAGEAAMAELAGRYARSRGPVTAQDLARFTGSTVTAAASGLAAADGLRSFSRDDVTYFLDAAQPAVSPRAAGPLLLLAGFDEYLIGYKGRDDQLDPGHFERIVPGRNGVFKPLLVRDGQIVGTWARALTARKLTITLTPFSDDDTLALLGAAGPEAARYASFLGLGKAVDLEVALGKA